MCRRRSSTTWRCWPGRWALSRWRAGRLCVPATTLRKWCPMQASIVLPELGAAPVVLSVWFADPGGPGFGGGRLVEVLVGGATFDVAAPATGRLAEKRALPNDPLKPGQVLGLVEVEAD